MDTGGDTYRKLDVVVLNVDRLGMLIVLVLQFCFPSIFYNMREELKD